VLKVLVSLRRKIPSAAQFIEHFVVKRHEAKIFPKAIGVIGLRGHQIAFWAQVEAASMQ
jgi:hypothetical protein